MNGTESGGAVGGGGMYAGGGVSAAMSKVAGPAIGLMVTVGVGIFLNLLGILLNVLGIGMGGAMGDRDEAFIQMLSGGIGVAASVLGIIIGIVIFLGAQKMKNLESYGFAMTASILAMIPCLSPCCVLGLPIGIWALVVLLSQDVKAAFRS